MNKIWKYAFLNALGTALYIVAVGLFLSLTGENKLEEGNKTFIPIFMMMLLVFSASVTGALIFGRPTLWYLDGKKKQALTLLFYTLLVFFALTLTALFILFYFK